MTQTKTGFRTAACLVGTALVALACWGCSTPPAVMHADALGWVGRAVLQKPENRDFRTRYDTVRVDSTYLPLIQQSTAGTDVIIFFGLWCPDSKREVPHFLKIADEAGMRDSTIRLYSLDRSKKSPDGLTEKYAIERVPTFIFFRGGKEIGRITESPRTTLEGDILAILAAS